MAIRNDQGIVLRGYPFGDADRVVVLLSPNHGKLRTVAKGVRKTTSRFGGRLEPFTHVDLVLYEGRNLDTITQAEGIDAFRAIRDDLDRITRASAMLEAVDQLATKGRQDVANARVVGKLALVQSAGRNVGRVVEVLGPAGSVHAAMRGLLRLGGWAMEKFAASS